MSQRGRGVTVSTAPRIGVRPPGVRFFLYGLLMRIRPSALAAFLKKFLRVRRHVIQVERGLFYIDPVSHLGFQLWKKGEYEPPMYRVLSALLRDGSVFVDLGANEGYFTVVGAKIVGETGRVVSIEPQRRLHPVFRANLELNGIGNVSLVDKAVSDRIGEATMHVSPSTDTGTTGLAANYRYPVPTDSVQTTTLAQVFSDQKLPHCDLIKIDIEGFEYEAVFGSPDLFRQGRIRRLVLQLHPRLLANRGLKPEAITEFLDSCGYTKDERFEELVYVAPGVAQPAG